ncbi:hypothetical protein [Desulfovibrio piger]|uniref:hypothetical protein n=1 Tax=Desulfovibrio piger TaxID=901 RepID=UPI0026EC24B6|nr:hypothetical protein [Desulfovibrio piger]
MALSTSSMVEWKAERPVELAFVFQTACKSSLDFHSYSSTRSTAKRFKSRQASPSVSYWSLTLCPQQPVYETRLPLPETGEMVSLASKIFY